MKPIIENIAYKSLTKVQVESILTRIIRDIRALAKEDDWWAGHIRVDLTRTSTSDEKFKVPFETPAEYDSDGRAIYHHMDFILQITVPKKFQEKAEDIIFSYLINAACYKTHKTRGNKVILTYKYSNFTECLTKHGYRKFFISNM